MTEAGLSEVVARALAEDVGPGDVTCEAVVPAGASAVARIVQKQEGVLFGLEAAEEVFRQVGIGAFERRLGEGEWRDEVPTEIACIAGPARAILMGERTALNLLGRLSGIATLTARYVAAAGSGVRILDTRKTTPGMRKLEKAAVAAAGGHNHRMGLFDAILIKENHAALAGGIGPAVAAARAASPDLPVEIECRALAEVEEALGAGAERILLDNMDLATLRGAVAARDAAESAAVLEASGGVSLGNVAEIAATGVDDISVGALTHSAPALDLSLLVEGA